MKNIRLLMSFTFVIGHLFVIPISLAGLAFNIEPNATILAYLSWLIFANVAYYSKRKSINIFERDAAYLFYKSQAVLIMFVMVLTLMVLGSALG